ncbi:protein-export chaperone SecB [Gemmatimonas sp.]|uniref:protein-export chaperone SecB n=1 Tax=Gemmatimonas sp. TaxID=1962908 RepID=UPI0022BCADB4|nr:protein-export chaperone SecB [Gemmatimonas sp.]MCZ8203391.1 protein-export chaperone SecB [Gemmatimonas sp.]
MSRDASKDMHSAGLKVSPPELWQLSFTRHELSEAFSTEFPPLLFGLGLNRITSHSLGVELSIEIKDFKPLTLRASYRAVFELEDSVDPNDTDQQLRFVAAQVGPSILYPFIRETVVSTVVKAGLPPLLPPVVNFRSVFDPNQIALPELVDSGDPKAND